MSPLHFIDSFTKCRTIENDRYPSLGQDVALKKMVLKSDTNGISREAIRELKLLREVHHANIVNVYDAYIQDDNMYMVMELLPNDLERIIRDARIQLSAAHIKTYMMMILQGMAHLHSKGIMHRDLKPANVLMALDGTMKIADFGGAKIAGSPDRRYVTTKFVSWIRYTQILTLYSCVQSTPYHSWKRIMIFIFRLK